jgi:hypothetical protein
MNTKIGPLDVFNVFKKNRRSDTKLHIGFFRFRKHSIYFFLEDNSITVVEEKRPNSGEISILIPIINTTIEYLFLIIK